MGSAFLIIFFKKAKFEEILFFPSLSDRPDTTFKLLTRK